MMGIVQKHHEPAPGTRPLEYGALHVAPMSTQFVVNLQRFFRMYWRRCNTSAP